jgi:hypothetical protein
MKGRTISLPSLAAACCILAAGAPAEADDIAVPDLGEAVPGHDGTTYLDLARLVVPDLAASDGGYFGGAPVAVRQIEGFGWTDGAADQTGPVTLMVLDFKSGGRDWLAALFELAPDEEAALALYDLSDAPRLLDAADVALDRFTGFAGAGRLATGPGDDVLLVHSTHFNSNQGYAATTLLSVDGDRIEPVDTIYTLDEHDCGYQRAQDLSFTAAPDAGGHGPVTARVVDAIEAVDEQCDRPPPAPSARSLTVTYRWNGKRYEADSDAFERLAAENEKRF